MIGDKEDISYNGLSTVEGFGDFIFTYVKPKAVEETPKSGTLTDQDRKNIHQMAAKAYQQVKVASATATSHENLPHTGSQESKGFLFMGLSLLGLASLFAQKEEDKA